MAKKESFYFQHDYNARNDPKMQRLIMNCGVAGVGIYWCIVEMLYEQGGKLPIEDIEVIAYNLHAEKTTLEEVVFGLNLFVFDDTHFWSERALEVLEERECFKTTQKQRALKGGAPKGNRNACKSIGKIKIVEGQKQPKTTQNNPVVVFEQSENNPIIKGKEIKGNNNKESNSNELPKKVEVASASSPLSETDNSLTVEKKEGEVSVLRDSGSAEERKETVPSIQVEEKPKREKASMPTPYEEIKTLWNKTDHGLPKVLVLSKARKSKMHLRFLEMGKGRDEGAMPVIETVFKKISESPFLRGGNGRGWKASFDWVFENGENWLKIYEGNYDERKGKEATTRPNECRGRETDRCTDDGTCKTENSYSDFAKRGFK